MPINLYWPITVNLHQKKDKDLVKFFDKLEDRSGWIKQAIRERLEREKGTK